MAEKIKYLMVDRELCIGAASCVAVLPEVFQLDDEDKAVILRKDGVKTSEKTDVDMLEVSSVDDETLLLAAQSCPTLAIFLYDAEGNQVYP
jgi:ferredoxin